MGMQVHFDLDDCIDNGATVSLQKLGDTDNDLWVADVVFENGRFSVDCKRGVTNVWRDIGSTNDQQMELLRILILNRICFSCN